MNTGLPAEEIWTKFPPHLCGLTSEKSRRKLLWPVIAGSAAKFISQETSEELADKNLGTASSSLTFITDVEKVQVPSFLI